ncbi:uncharacterized protein [Palaemon carinicauda]|uniref:uncharacterized protein n=1 Tax=Palaemon carinicauda TaxID=392227 RepID=UPI0035B5C96D
MQPSSAHLCALIQPRPARPPQQRTPARQAHPDARLASPRSPARLARPQVNMPVLSDQRPSTFQRANLPSRYSKPALSRPRPVLPDTRPCATALSRPPVPHQDAARPRIPAPHVPAPALHTPSPSPARAHAPTPVPARLHHLLHAITPKRHRALAPAPPTSHAHAHVRAPA